MGISNPPHRRRFQFTLAALFVTVFACSAAAWLLAQRVRHAELVKWGAELSLPAPALAEYVPNGSGAPFILHGADYGRINIAVCVFRRVAHVTQEARPLHAALTEQLQRYQDFAKAAELLHGLGAAGGEDDAVALAKLQIALTETALAWADDDKGLATRKLAQCVVAAQEFREAQQKQFDGGAVAGMHDAENAILETWMQRHLARAGGDEEGYTSALEDQLRLIDEFIVQLETYDGTRESGQLVHGALLARARVRSRLAHARDDDETELAAWNDVQAEASAIRDIEDRFMRRTELGMLFCGGSDYWCAINFSLFLSEPGLLLAEPPERARTRRARTAQQKALAEYELLLREAVKQAEGSECPEYWQCQHSLAELDLVEAGY